MFFSVFVLAAAATLPALANEVPYLEVPACPNVGTVHYDRSVPDKTTFPLTQVKLCYDNQAIHIDFTAFNETNYYYNASQTTNDPIYKWEVMETFIYQGTNDPQTYLEFEISPRNVTFQAFIYNPSKLKATDTFYITEPVADGLEATTSWDQCNQTWASNVSIPLGLFNIDKGRALGTQWRMNFFRTVVAPDTFPSQLLGAWSPPDEPSFHLTPYFGHVTFV